MRRELVIPFELSRPRLERDDGSRIKIVALALVAVVIRAGIAGGPVKERRFRIVGAREPSRGTAMLERPPAPRFRARLAGRRNGPEAPGVLTGGGLIGIDKSTDSFVAARHAGDHQVVDHQRRTGR